MKICKKLFGKKTPKLQFISLLPEAEYLNPIIPAKDLKNDFMESAKKEFLRASKSDSFGITKQTFVYRCPGIKDFLKTGHVITTLTDITITTNADGTFSWVSAINFKDFKNVKIIGDALEFMSSDFYSNHIKNSEDIFPLTIKFNTPWAVYIPEGYNLLISQIPYSNEDRFKVLPGLLGTVERMTAIRIQVSWHVKEGIAHIKAGTPLALLTLVPADNPEFSMREATEKEIKFLDINWLEKFRTNIVNYNKSSCIFEKALNDLREDE